MRKQELIAFLQKEAAEALKTIFPKILVELEEKYVPGETLFVPMGQMLESYKDPNMRTMITNEAVKRLESLGYHANSTVAKEGVGINVS